MQSATYEEVSYKWYTRWQHWIQHLYCSVGIALTLNAYNHSYNVLIPNRCCSWCLPFLWINNLNKGFAVDNALLKLSLLFIGRTSPWTGSVYVITNGVLSRPCNLSNPVTKSSYLLSRIRANLRNSETNWGKTSNMK